MNWNPNQNTPSLTNTNKIKRLQSIQKTDTPQNLFKKSDCGFSFCFIFSCFSCLTVRNEDTQKLNNTKIRNSVNIDP
jgi:hypothetical protein